MSVNQVDERSIPACAGEAGAREGKVRNNKVYPRVCGGSLTIEWRESWEYGLSPRVRGKPIAVAEAQGEDRSIPACAGEARLYNCKASKQRVYPRVCGGSTYLDDAGVKSEGLSPRVRGKRSAAVRTAGRVRSIPACAGEAQPAPTPSSAPRVYPRVCGGSDAKRGVGCFTRGLSPRVRGKQPAAVPGLSWSGSIPACAGEACWRKSGGKRTEVYPRVCGGSRL